MLDQVRPLACHPWLDALNLLPRLTRSRAHIARCPLLAARCSLLAQSKDLKAALDKKEDVRKILESKPDLTRAELNELVHTNAACVDMALDLSPPRPACHIWLAPSARLPYIDMALELSPARPACHFARLPLCPPAAHPVGRSPRGPPRIDAASSPVLIASLIAC